MRHTMGLSDERLAQLAHSSLVGSGAPADLVADGVELVEEWLTTPA